MSTRDPAKRIDYTYFEADWMAGLKSIRQMASDYTAATGRKVSHEAIRKYFDKIGLQRNLKDRIASRAEEIAIRRDEVASPAQAAREEEVVEAIANQTAKALWKHKALAERKLSLVDKMLAEIEAQTNEPELFAQLGELMATAENANDLAKLQDAYSKMLATPQRIDNLKKLTETAKNVIGLHRQSLGVSDNANGEANAPVEPTMTPTEAGRRVAFLLLNAAKEK